MSSQFLFIEVPKMYHVRIDLRRLLPFTNNKNPCAYSLRSLATVSSLFQPINLAPKNAETKRGESIVKSQKVISPNTFFPFDLKFYHLILQLLNEMGIVRQASPGMYTMLPLGLRSLHKLKHLIATEMNAAGCQELSFPFLTPAHLWKQTGTRELLLTYHNDYQTLSAVGRIETTGQELLSCTDRHNRQYVLSPVSFNFPYTSFTLLLILISF